MPDNYFAYCLECNHVYETVWDITEVYRNMPWSEDWGNIDIFADYVVCGLCPHDLHTVNSSKKLPYPIINFDELGLFP